MVEPIYPPLPLVEWQPTRDALNGYAKIVGRVRRALTPYQKHWWHVSLRVAAAGLTTTPMRAGSQTVEILLDLTAHEVLLRSSRSERRSFPMRGQSAAAFCEQLSEALSDLEFDVSLDPEACAGAGAPSSYDKTAVSRFWQALCLIDATFKQFKHGLREETSPVQLWPHHFDLAVLWLSGRLVPDQDPDNEEYADEQMNFGFSTGDGTIAEPYFYATAYPTPAGFTDTPLPQDAFWQTTGFTGAVLPYRALTGTADPDSALLGFLRTVHAAGAALMKEAAPE